MRRHIGYQILGSLKLLGIFVNGAVVLEHGLELGLVLTCSFQGVVQIDIVFTTATEGHKGKGRKQGINGSSQ